MDARFHPLLKKRRRGVRAARRVAGHAGGSNGAAKRHAYLAFGHISPSPRGSLLQTEAEAPGNGAKPQRFAKSDCPSIEFMDTEFHGGNASLR